MMKGLKTVEYREASPYYDARLRIIPSTVEFYYRGCHFGAPFARFECFGVKKIPRVAVTYKDGSSIVMNFEVYAISIGELIFASLELNDLR